MASSPTGWAGRDDAAAWVWATATGVLLLAWAGDAARGGVRRTLLLVALVAAGGDEVTVPLSPGTLGISCFQVPVVLHRGGAPRVVLTDASGTTTEVEGHVLDEATSAGLFARATGLQRIDVFGR